MRDVCKRCGERLPADRTQCLNCGHVPNAVADPRYLIRRQPEPGGSPVGRALWSLIRLCGIVMIFFTGLFAVALHAGHDQPSGAAQPAPVSAPPAATRDALFTDGSEVLKVSGSRLLTDPSGSRAVVGRIKNIGPDALSDVRVDITLYDRRGTQVGTTADSVNSLKSGKVWRFRARVPQNAATRDEVKYVTCY